MTERIPDFFRVKAIWLNNQRLLIMVVLLLILLPSASQAQSPGEGCTPERAVPFSVDNTHIRIWNGGQYVPIFVKGINLGVAVPGTFPGQLAATRQQYRQWFGQIREAGFNAIRIYTLHFPRFYQELKAFNEEHPQNPLLVLQGIWLEGGLEGYQDDLHFLTDTFDYQIRETIDCVHGNRVIKARFGKAYGTYEADISEWTLGYILGREIMPREVLTTNRKHPGDTSYQGKIYSLASGNPTEIWVTRRLDELATHERSTYQSERPVSFSSWPTLDPLDHQEVFPDEDTASIDLANIDFADTSAGYFASYHAYPYYPDFISTDPEYQLYADHIGQNSYLGYLHDLKDHYSRVPLIIAEYGVPSSWGVAHYAFTGTHHGGNNEVEQGAINNRLLHNIHSSLCGGGIQFSWIDEWWKPTWVNAPVDYLLHRRPFWHNMTAPEQNFGLLKFRKKNNQYQPWASFPENTPIDTLYAAHDYSFFHLRVMLNESFRALDSIWVALDTYAPDLGERLLPTGDTITNRAEFAIKITNHDAELYVTQAYDLYGKQFGVSSPEQLYRSIATTGAPWHILRWKNNIGTLDIQYIGDMESSYRKVPQSSRDAVVLSDNRVDIRLPWSLLYFVDPSTMRVVHDERTTPSTEDTTSEGIAVSVFYHNRRMTTDSRYSWASWNTVEDVTDVKKQAYSIVQNRLNHFNNPPVARCNHYMAGPNELLQTTAETGILNNDFDIDGNTFQINRVQGPNHGTLELSPDGSFSYKPYRNFLGLDHFTYSLLDEYGGLDTTHVFIRMKDPLREQVFLYPNPAGAVLHVHIDGFSRQYTLKILNMLGQTEMEKRVTREQITLNTGRLNPGHYILIVETPRNRMTKKIIIR